MESYFYKLVDWIKSSEIRKKAFKIFTILYFISVVLYLVFIFSLTSHKNSGWEVLGASLFFLTVKILTLTFKKEKNEKLEK